MNNRVLSIARSLPLSISRSLALSTLLPLCLATSTMAQYSPSWSSLDTRPVPEWYTDAKFGIFVHWGLYSVPAFAPVDASLYAKYAEWYWRRLTDPSTEGYAEFRAFHDATYGPHFRYQ